MEIRLSKDDNTKVPICLEMVKQGIFGKKVPSLIINHDAVIPIYVFRPGNLSDLHTEITVGDTMGVINIKGTPVIPGCIDGKVILPFFDIQEILLLPFEVPIEIAEIDRPVFPVMFVFHSQRQSGVLS